MKTSVKDPDVTAGLTKMLAEEKNTEIKKVIEKALQQLGTQKK